MCRYQFLPEVIKRVRSWQALGRLGSMNPPLAGSGAQGLGGSPMAGSEA